MKSLRAAPVPAETVAPRLARRLAAMRPVPHGSVAADEVRALGLDPSAVLDFSVNANPLGPAPSVVAAVQMAPWARYPGDDEGPLRRALAESCGVAPTSVALGNGSSELLWLLTLALLNPGDLALVVVPTFGEYARAARVAGADVLESSTLPAEPGPRPARVAFVCNPNNPTGWYRSADEIEAVLERSPGTVVVLDEAYAPFVEARWRSEDLLARYPNLVVLRSMTKDHALPGLRLGYALAHPAVAAALEAVRPPWSVNAGALRAGLAALQAPALEHVQRGRLLVSESRAILTRGFQSLGFLVEPSFANFVLVDVRGGAAFRSALLPRGFVVRDCASFGLPAHVRVACRLADECAALLRAVAEIVGRG